MDEKPSVMLTSTNGLHFWIDKEDLERVTAQGNWHVNKKSMYVHRCEMIGKDRNNIYLHRFLMGLNNTNDMEVDHINGCPQDNRKNNLRLCSHHENLNYSDKMKQSYLDRVKKRNHGRTTYNKSGYKGVTIRKLVNGVCYVATTRFNNKWLYIKSCKTAAEAARCYDAKVIELFGLGNCFLNFPEEHNF